ncbi:MAG: hypothetical protein ACOYEQ_09615 [Bacillota bacterium]
MENKGVLTKVLAWAGTMLVWIPILFTVITSVVGTISSRMFRFDYLMPAELFPLALAGGLSLFWASRRAHSQQRLIGWGLLAAVLFLVGGQAFAVVTGLASGAIEPTGWPMAVALSSITLYSLAVIELCISGVLLLRSL